MCHFTILVLALNLKLLKKIFLKMAQGKVLPQEKFYPEKKSTPEKVYPGKNPQFWSNQADIGET